MKTNPTLLLSTLFILGFAFLSYPSPTSHNIFEKVIGTLHSAKNLAQVSSTLPILPPEVQKLMGPLTPISSTPSQFAKYENDFVTWENTHWNLDKAGGGSAAGCNPSVPQIDGTNYYDRAFMLYQMWARTGNQTYRNHADAIALCYRDGYLAPANYNAQPHNWQMEGLAVHYLLTGDTNSKKAVGAVANLAMNFSPSKWIKLQGENYTYWEGRIQARSLTAYVLADLVGDTSQNWKALSTELAGLIIANQHTDGSYKFPGWSSQTNPSVQANYMVGMLNYSLAQYYRLQVQDPAVVASIKKSVDYMWSTQWCNTGFLYFSGFACGANSSDPISPDLSGLQMYGPAFLYSVTGDTSYKTQAESILTSGMNGSWLNGQKQFNQSYRESQLALALTILPPSSAIIVPITPTPTPPPTPTLTLTASQSSITLGQSVTLTWSTTNATSCTASGGWSGSAALSGSQSVTPTQTTTYTLNCGSASQAVTITVSVPPSTPPITTPPPPVTITPPTTTPAPTTPNVGNGMNDTFPPSIPDRLTAFTSHAGELTVRWDPSFDRGGIGGYKVYRDSAQVSDTPKEEYIDKGLTPNQSYTYSVSAYDRSGNSSSQSSSRTFKVDGSITTPTVVTPTQTSTPTFSFTKNLRYGQENSDVLALQQKLKSLGYFSASVTPNGYFGRQTLTAVIKYQRAMGLSTTGFVGPLTRGRLSAN